MTCSSLNEFLPLYSEIVKFSITKCNIVEKIFAVVSLDENVCKESKVPEFSYRHSNCTDPLSDFASPFQSLVADEKAPATRSASELDDAADRQLFTPDLDSLQPTLDELDGHFFLDGSGKPTSKTDQTDARNEQKQQQAHGVNSGLIDSNGCVVEQSHIAEDWRRLSQSNCESSCQHQRPCNAQSTGYRSCACDASAPGCSSAKTISTPLQLAYNVKKAYNFSENNRSGQPPKFSNHTDKIQIQNFHSGSCHRGVHCRRSSGHYYDGASKESHTEALISEQSQIGLLQCKQHTFISSVSSCKRNSLPLQSYAENDLSCKVDGPRVQCAPDSEINAEYDCSSGVENCQVMASPNERHNFRQMNYLTSNHGDQSNGENKRHYPPKASNCENSAGNDQFVRQPCLEAGHSLGPSFHHHQKLSFHSQEKRKYSTDSNQDFTFLYPGSPFSTSFTRRSSEGILFVF